MHSKSLRRVMVTLSATLVLGSACSSASSTKDSRDPSRQTRPIKPGVKVSTAPSKDEVPTAVVALIDGFMTCSSVGDASGQNRAANMTVILKDVLAASKKNNKKDPLYLISCFSSDPSKVYYSTSAKPESVTESSISDLIKKFGTLIDSVALPEVYVVGYSYGGWTSMKLASELKPSTMLLGLVTIDPISVVNCTTIGFVNSFFNQSIEKGCTESPTDFSAEALTTIDTHAKKWLNFYQEDQAVLHSGPVEVAQNYRKDYPGSSLGHSDIAKDQAVISEISDLISR